MECRNKHQIILAFFFPASVSQDFGINSYTAITPFVLTFTELSIAQKVGMLGSVLTFPPDLPASRILKELIYTLKRQSHFSWNTYFKPDKLKSLVQGWRIPFFLHPFGQAMLGPELHTACGAGKAVSWPLSSPEFSCIKGFFYENKQPNNSRFKPSTASWGFVLIKVLAQTPQRKPKTSQTLTALRDL